MPRVPLPPETRCGVANTVITIVTALRPATHLSTATATDPDMRALHVAGDLEVGRLCGTLDDTPIRVRLHRQLPSGRVPDILGGGRRTARLLEHIA